MDWPCEWQAADDHGSVCAEGAVGGVEFSACAEGRLGTDNGLIMKVVVEYVDGVTKRFDGVREYAVNGGILILHALVDVTPTLIPWMHVRFVTPWTVVDEQKRSMGFKPPVGVAVDDGQDNGTKV